MRSFFVTCLAAYAAAVEYTEALGAMNLDWNLMVDNANYPNSDAIMAQTEVLTTFYTVSQPELPEVCEEGQMCRDEILVTTTTTYHHEWQEAYTNIADELNKAWLRCQELMDEKVTEATHCESECPCKDILIEYTAIVEMQRDIKDEIDQLKKEIKNLEIEKHEVTEQCPDYTTITIVKETQTEVSVTETVDESNMQYIWDADKQEYVPITEETVVEEYNFNPDEQYAPEDINETPGIDMFNLDDTYETSTPTTNGPAYDYNLA